MVEKAKSGDLKAVNGSAASQAAVPKRKRRWDQTADQTPNATPKKVSSWDQADSSAEVSLVLGYVEASAMQLKPFSTVLCVICVVVKQIEALH